MRRFGVVAGLMVAFALAAPTPAPANCHVATLEENRFRVSESVGQVEIVVELEGAGPNTCTGTIEWRTREGSATADEDFDGAVGALRWQTGDTDRRKSFRVAVRNDTDVEGEEQFSVAISAPPGSGIQPEAASGGAGGPVATITIVDDDQAPASPPPTGTPTETQTPTTEPTATPTVTASPTETGTGVAAPVGDTGAGSNAAVIGVLAAVLALAGGGAWWLRRRAGERP